jgi:predicted aspartyl protease
MKAMRWLAMLIGLAAAPAAPGCGIPLPAGRTVAPADAAAGEVAFELAGPGGAAMVVPVRINGQGPYQFVLDTGATITCLDHKLSDELQLPERSGQIGFGAGIGAAGQVKLVGVDSLNVGTASASDLTACAIDLQGIQEAGIKVDGLLGLNFLRSYHVTIDFERNVLRLQDPSATAGQAEPATRK